jgi:hypothetical protein
VSNAVPNPSPNPAPNLVLPPASNPVPIQQEKVTKTDKTANKKVDMKLILISAVVLFLILAIVSVIAVKLLKRQNNKGGAESESSMYAGNDSDAYFEYPFNVGNTITFGSYEQDGDTSNGKEPIEWYVADYQDGNYLLISNYILDYQVWDDGTSGGDSALNHNEELKYEDCSLRSWMNDTFAAEAFSDKERSMILPVSFREDEMTVSNSNEYASDYAFILSNQEVVDNFGKGILIRQGSDFNEIRSSAWVCSPTDYAISQGLSYVTVDQFCQLNYERQAEELEKEGYEDIKGYLNTCYGYDSYLSGEFSASYVAETFFGFSDDDYMDRDKLASWCIRDRFEGKTDDCVLAVDEIGEIQYTSMYGYFGIRPAIYLHLTADDFQNEKKEADSEVLDALEPYFGTWEADTNGSTMIVIVDDEGGSLSSLKADGGCSYITIDEDYIDLSPYTGSVGSRMPVSDFTYEKTDVGDTFTYGDIRLLFREDFRGYGERLSIQFEGTGPDGWGTSRRFVRSE